MKGNVKTYLSVLALLGILTIAACESLFSGCGSGDYYDFASSNRLTFVILDKTTKENILYVGQTKYNYDTVRIFDINWDVAYPDNNQEWSATNGAIGLKFLNRDSDKGVLNTLISRSYFMYFDQHDTDTIDIAFEMKKNKCGDQILKYLKVAYNDSVYFDGKTESMIGLYFLKE